MRGVWSRWVDEEAPARRPFRLGMTSALALAFLALAVATHLRFLLPTVHGLGLASQLVTTTATLTGVDDQNGQLGRVHDYLKTPDGQELAARSELFALKPGERVIAVDGAAPDPPAAPRDLPGRVQQTLQRIGDGVVGGLQRSLLVLKVWTGVVPLEPVPDPAPSAPLSTGCPALAGTVSAAAAPGR